MPPSLLWLFLCIDVGLNVRVHAAASLKLNNGKWLLLSLLWHFTNWIRNCFDIEMSLLYFIQYIKL